MRDCGAVWAMSDASLVVAREIKRSKPNRYKLSFIATVVGNS
jgi:hypothetical protein